MTKKIQIDYTDKVINYFRSTVFEAVMSSGIDRDLGYKIIRNFDKINQNEYKYIRRMIEEKK